MVCADKEFQEVLVRLGPTILGVKPAELLNIKFGNNLNTCRNCFSEFPKFKYVEIKDFPNINRKQLFFYHEDCMSEVLAQRGNLKFLTKIGYPPTFELNGYLDVLINKLQSNSFPHEIGIFLGYPLKDVLGYLGLSPLKLVKIRGWRYYGSEDLSLKQYNKYSKAREVFKFFLDNFNTSPCHSERGTTGGS